MLGLIHSLSHPQRSLFQQRGHFVIRPLLGASKQTHVLANAAGQLNSLPVFSQPPTPRGVTISTQMETEPLLE